MSSNINCSCMTMSSSTFLSRFSVKYVFQPNYSDYCKLDSFWSNKIVPESTWNPLNTKLVNDGSCVISVHICVRQLRPPFKMADITKNRNFVNSNINFGAASEWVLEHFSWSFCEKSLSVDLYRLSIFWAEMIFGWFALKIMYNFQTLYRRWLLLLKVEISLNGKNQN